MNLYLKKLVSLNPKRHEFIELSRAIERYGHYILAVEAWRRSGKALPAERKAKSFEAWLKTEI